MQSRMFCILSGVLSVTSGAFASGDGGEGTLNPFVGTFADSIWTVIAFLTLLFVLWKFAWGPILGGLKAREAHIEGQIEEAANRVKDADKVLAQYNDRLADVEAEGRQIIAKHTRKAEQKGQEIHQKAMTEAEALRLKAEADVQRAQIEAHGELWTQAGDILARLGEDVLGKAMDDDDNKKLIDDAISRFKEEELN